MSSAQQMLLSEGSGVVSPPPPPPPTARWTLDEASTGNRADSIGSVTLTSNNAVGFTAGLIGANCATFNGTNQSLSAGNVSAVQLGDTDWCITGWFKPTYQGASRQSIGTAVQKVLLGKDAAGQRDYVLDMGQSSPSLRGYINGGGTVIVTDPTTLFNQNWHFFALAHDSVNNLLKIAVNNSDWTTFATGGVAPNVGTAAALFGARQYSGNEGWFQGNIDDLRVYNGRIPSAAELTALYGGPTRSPNNPTVATLTGTYASQLYDFCVIDDPTDNTKLRIYCSGMASPVATGQESVHLFTCPKSDPSSWTFVGQILTPSVPEGTIRLDSVQNVAGAWTMFYSAYRSGTSSDINRATSTDGLTWTKQATVLTATGQGRNDGNCVSQGATIVEGSTWTMLYSYRDTTINNILPGFRCAQSTDGGATWAKVGTGDVLTTSPMVGEFHQFRKVSSTYQLFYETGSPFQICLATATVVTGPYTDHPKNPILVGSMQAGKFDRYHVATPCVVTINGVDTVFYCGASEFYTGSYVNNHWYPGIAQWLNGLAIGDR